MNNYDLLKQILDASDEHTEPFAVDARIDIPNNEVVIRRTLGPLSPRTRVVRFAPLEVGHQIEYSEVSHGAPQPPTNETADTTHAMEVSRLVGRIWTHLKG